MEEIFGHGLWENKQSKKQVKETTSFFNNLQNARGDFVGLWGPPIKKYREAYLFYKKKMNISCGIGCSTFLGGLISENPFT